MSIKKEKYYTVEELTEKLSLPGYIIKHYITMGRLKSYVLESDYQDLLDEDKKKAERTKETQERMQKERQKRDEEYRKKHTSDKPVKYWEL